MYRILFIILILTLSLTLQGKESFTQQEQQQISVVTPGLFDHYNSFQIDFTQLPKTGYSFPLPVGVVTGNDKRELTIETKAGDAVKAMFDGIVRLSYNIMGRGNTIVIRHDNGLETVYSGNAQNLVKVGDHVQAGRTIAIVGSPSSAGMLAAAPRLIFYIMVNGGKINPSTIINVHSHKLHRQIVKIAKKGGKIEVVTEHSKTQESGGSKLQPAKMDLSTNNPFQGQSVYRLNLDRIRANEWHYPLADSHVISGYGGKRRHSGVDIKNGPGNDVYAAFDGVVVQSGNFSGYGKCITLRHENGLETRYSHNSKNYVSVGDKVKAGQVIAVVGRTGRATTEHLHFETRINGRAFDPSYVFDHSKKALQAGTLQFKKGGSVVRIKKN